jgi:hypothetical protein
VTADGPTCGPCPAGYVDLMGACVDVDECDFDDACPTLRTCRNEPGGYACEDCPVGTDPAGESCVDINECEGPGACDPHRPCSNTTGGFACGPCETGYAAHGVRCVNVDECVQPDACGPHRSCVDTDGGFSCGSCLSGFEDVDGKCQDIDECDDEHACAAEAFCFNAPGTYSCHCPAYYEEAAAGQACVDTRLRGIFTWPLYGLQAMPFGTDLLLAGTLDKETTIGGETRRPAGKKDVFIARLDQQRQVVWYRQYGGLAEDRMFWANVDSQGNLLTTGFTDGGLDLGTGPIDAIGARVRFVAKFSAANGSLMWSHTIANADLPSNNWLDDWEGYVSADRDDNVLFCGRFWGSTQLGSASLNAVNSWDAFVAKIAADGTVLWAKGWGSGGNEQCRAVHADVDGNIVAGGMFDRAIAFGEDPLSSAGSMDVFLAKLDPNGEPIWAKRTGGNDYDELGRLALDGDGNIVLGGTFWGYGQFGNEWLEAFDEDSDAWLGKWTADGVPLWGDRFGGQGNDGIWGVASGPDNEIAIAGFFSDTIDFGEGERKSDGTDGFIAKYEPGSALIWSFDLGDAGYDTAAGVRLDARGRAYATGWYQQPIYFGPGAPVAGGMYVLELEP